MSPPSSSPMATHPALPLTLGLHSPLPAAQGFLHNLQQGLSAAKVSLAKAQHKMKTQADKHRRPVSFHQGDMVLLSSRNLQLAGPQKLSPPFIGPFKIQQVLSPLNYRLELPPHLKMHDVFHVSLLKPYHSPLPGQPSSTGAQPVLVDGEPEWEVEAAPGLQRQHQQLGVSSSSLGKTALPTRTLG